MNLVSAAKLHMCKPPHRTHYIVEWAAQRNLTQADIAREIGADKSLVCRWFEGKLPSSKWLIPLAGLFHTDVTGLFRHPDEDWIARFLRGRSAEERERIRQTIETAFPKNTRTNG